ncbi:hypothetical protein GIX45_17525 [Erwinia sp. CPCC 100877]|nr:hypothetical protein [Erwinia sp. CPCC 100877]
MYLKKVSKKDLRKYGLTQGLGLDSIWYYKMYDDGTKARNMKGSLLLTCLSPEGLKEALAFGEFTRVEK